MDQFVPDSQLVSTKLPNSFSEVTSKYTQETSVISNAPLSLKFLETISIFQKCQSASFRHFWAMIKLIMNKDNLMRAESPQPKGYNPLPQQRG
jgi:hypothetical protein